MNLYDFLPDDKKNGYNINNLIPKKSKILKPEEAAKLVELVEEKKEEPKNEKEDAVDDLVLPLFRKVNLKSQADEQKKEGTHTLHCPNCDSDLPISMHTMGAGGRFHCPLCEKYFDKQGNVYTDDEPWTPDC